MVYADVGWFKLQKFWTNFKVCPGFQIFFIQFQFDNLLAIPFTSTELIDVDLSSVAYMIIKFWQRDRF